MVDWTPIPARARIGRPPGVRVDGAAVRSRRLEVGMSQEDLAHRAGVALRTVKNAEAGRGLAPFTAQCLALALDVAYVAIVRDGAPTVPVTVQDDPEALFEWALAARPRADRPDGADLIAALQADLPRWCAVYDAAAAGVLHASASTPIARPEDLPAPRPAIPPGAATLLLDPVLLTLVRLFGPRQAPGWIVAGLAVARQQGDAQAVAALSALYGWWWFGRRGAVEMGRAWSTYAWEAAAAAGEPEPTAEYGLHAALYAWLARGNEEAARMREDALRVARQADVGWRAAVSVRVSAASSRALQGDPRGARALLHEASALVPDGEDSQARTARAAVDLDLATCARLLDDVPVPSAQVKRALSAVHAFVRPYPIVVFKLGLLARWLGVEPPWPPLTSREALLSAGPFVVDQLAMLIQLCAEHGVAFPGVYGEHAAVETPLGPLSRVGLTVSDAGSRGLDLQLDFLCPAGDRGSLLDAEHARYALEAIEAGCAPDHPLLDVLRDLAG